MAVGKIGAKSCQIMDYPRSFVYVGVMGMGIEDGTTAVE
jgi:hypothetical protein